jgi:outer membrane protein assembly factor BamD
MRIFTAIIVALIAIQSGCSGKKVDENDPASLYADAEEDIQSEHYQVAIDKLRIIKNKFPYSKYAVDAKLRTADVFFLQESFAEAAMAYESFCDLHPRHEKVAYAMFRVGKSYYNEIPGTVAKDLTPATKSLDAFSAFLARFPQNPESTEAKNAITEIRKTLAEKELYIGSFYSRQDKPEAARARLKKLIEAYPDTEQAKEAKKALEKLPPPKGDTGP